MRSIETNHKASFKTVTCLSMLGLLFTSTSAQAIGFRPVGAKMDQVGGAGIAMPFDPTSGNVNQALVGKLDNEISFHPGLVFQRSSLDSSKAHLTFGNPIHPSNKHQNN